MRRGPRLTAPVALLLGATIGVPALATQPAPADLTRLVNPLAGSLGPGFVTVAAGVPFGMVTPGPATTLQRGDDPVNYVGYAYQDPDIRGFALTHFSGAGIHIGGELPMMPTTGAVRSNDPRQWSSPYDHAQENAHPGYYETTLRRYRTRVQLTATTRVAVERYTFPKARQANVLFDTTRDNDSNQSGETQNGALHIVDARTVSGSVDLPGSGGITIYFDARFDRPFAAHGTWGTAGLRPGSSASEGHGAGGWVTFDASHNRTVGVRIGISYVDSSGAVGNVSGETPDGTSFEAVRAAAHTSWNGWLHHIEVAGGVDPPSATFYTSLYHALLMPTTYDDVDGRYLGFDNTVHDVAGGHHHYTDLSLWDTYRTQTPLLALIAPDIAHDVGISLLDDADQNGHVIPKWVRGNRDYSIMGGDSGTPTLATLVTDGALTGVDAQRAYDAILQQATTSTGPRDDLDVYLAKHYIPIDVSDRGAAVTLEYAIDDAAVAALAPRYGTQAQATEFTRRAEFWHSLLDSRHFLHPRTNSGAWAKPTSVGVTDVWNPAFSDGWQEGTGWQYLWLVPQDVRGLANAMGRAAMTRRLDEFFSAALNNEAAPVVPQLQTQASLFGVYYVGNQYTPANETDLQAPWLYLWVGDPARTQQIVHAESRVFSASPYGLPGNDDAGTMSAAYVLSAIGLYQVQPGFDAWELSTPLFSSVAIRAAEGRPRLRVRAPGASAGNQYAASARLSAAPLNRAWLTTAEVTTGRTLAFTLSPRATSWASGPSAAPPSLSGR
ncbi:MAG: GH92 family glycosyl hydrolase [Actinomycetes bacterium]